MNVVIYQAETAFFVILTSTYSAPIRLNSAIGDEITKITTQPDL
jgi:hypothetical protein